ncbi:MAG: alpha-galactosidase [Bacillota bacterium]|nr:alpha-galactosidase [Bacillota bacterium]
MKKYEKLKIAIIGAGSVSFCPSTVLDIFKSEEINTLPLEIALMDIKKEALEVSFGFCQKIRDQKNPQAKISATTNLKEALQDADFVVTAIEKNRYHYWSQDFHIPRNYGFRQIYGENGGPGGLFHTLRNLGPMLEIAHAMEEVCPDALLLNYTNPEAKLVEIILKETKIKAVGLCHGEWWGVWQVAHMLGMKMEDIETEACGLNHFACLTKIVDKKTGKDLYPLLKEKEKQMPKLAHWDHDALSRLMLRLYGVWMYPGANHIGEYFAWSDAFLASAAMQFFYDPATENPWDNKNNPLELVYTVDSIVNRDWETDMAQKDAKDIFEGAFTVKDTEESSDIVQSSEYGVPIIEAIVFNKTTKIGAVNVLNDGYAPNLPNGMAVEIPAIVDGDGIHPQKTAKIPTALAAMIATQGAITELLHEAYNEKSRNKLLQAVLLDPTVSSYNNAVAMINDMFEAQKEVLPDLRWN